MLAVMSDPVSGNGLSSEAASGAGAGSDSQPQAVSPQGTTGTRILSYSEVSRALNCMAQWDFAYGGHLAGTALKPKVVAPILSQGRAFGQAVAALHAEDRAAAIAALDESLDADADRQREFGLHDEVDHQDKRNRLLGIIENYAQTADLFNAYQLEGEVMVPIPSRAGDRESRSSKYRLLCYLDAVADDPVVGGNFYAGHWLVEFKLRGRLSPVDLIQLSRQLRWYAWAYERRYEQSLHGVLTIEVLNEPPKPPRILKSGKPSHAKDQLCTARAYLDACAEHDVEVNAETFEALNSRRWYQAVPIRFREGELAEAGRELVDAARLIHALDTGAMMPLRNVKPANCNGCAFKQICPSPDDRLVDELFERTVPKRLRPTIKEAENDQQEIVPKF